MNLTRLLRLTVVLSAALYVGCSDAGNPETGEGPALTPTGEVEDFEVTSPPKAMPADVTFQDGDGNTVRFADLRGRTVLLNLWATWCAPCKVEMPSLDRLQEKMGGERFTVVTLSSDRGGKNVVEPYFEEAGLDLPRYYDPENKAGLALGVMGLPTSILIDEEGRELGRFLGDAEWDGPDAIALIEQAMGKP
jgi:thiol-disulfide isomerase/thioredoxin